MDDVQGIVQFLYAMIFLMMAWLVGTSLWEVIKVLSNEKYKKNLSPLKSHAILGVVGSTIVCLLFFYFITGEVNRRAGTYSGIEEFYGFIEFITIIAWIGLFFIALYEGAKEVQKKAETPSF